MKTFCTYLGRYLPFCHKRIGWSNQLAHLDSLLQTALILTSPNITKHQKALFAIRDLRINEAILPQCRNVYIYTLNYAVSVILINTTFELENNLVFFSNIGIEDLMFSGNPPVSIPHPS